MKEMLLGAFDNRNMADRVIDDLQAAGYEAKDISVITQRSREEFERLRGAAGRKTKAGVGTGALGGAIAGGITGLFLGAIGIIVIGPIAALLGLTGALATTVTGTVIGAIAGGIATALMNLGVPEREARTYEECINAGGAVVAVPIDKLDEREVKDIFQKNEARDLVSVDIKDRKA